MKVSVGSRLFSQTQTRGRLLHATVSEVFVDSSESYFLCLPTRFLQRAEGGLFTDADCRSMLLADVAGGDEFLETPWRCGFAPIKVADEQELDTSVFGFSSTLPQSLDTVESRGFEGFVASRPRIVPGINCSVPCVLVDCDTILEGGPVVGDPCVGSSGVWGVVSAISDDEGLVAVTPLNEIYTEFEEIGLKPAPSSEIERRRRRKTEREQQNRSTELSAVFDFINILLETVGDQSVTLDSPNSYNDLTMGLYRLSSVLSPETQISNLPAPFGYKEGVTVALRELLEPGQLLCDIYLDHSSGALVYDPSLGHSSNATSVASLLSAAFMDQAEYA